jgi:large subunit ribosomal protein L24
VQTTLLGIAIAIILALVTALVGPLFIDWNKYRGEFEARASQMTGLQVRVAGPIEARLLPTPTMTLQRIDIFRPGDASAIRARRIGIEFSLSSLLRGEWKATDLRVEGAEFALGLDSSGHLDWPAPSIGFDPDSLSIERLDIVDSRAILAEAASGTGLVLEKLEFKGELRSLAGPIRGEGSFVMGGQHYPYRVAVSRAGEDGAVRVRFGLDPIDRPLLAEVDTSIWVENGVPRFEGSLNLARPVGRAPAGAQSLIIEPWRISSKIRGDSTSAVLEQIEFQYGPDDRAMKLKGDAKLSFGSQPEFNGVLSSTQLDLDRLLALPEATRRRPLAAIKALTDTFAATPRLPIPVKLGISVENVTLAGATLQRVSGDLKTGDVKSDSDRPDAGTWDVESLDFRAPGAAQIKLSGRLSVTPQGIAFAGPARIDARDPRGFVAWLSDRAEASAGSGPFRAEGDVRLGRDTIAIDHLQAEVDRMSLEGRLAYSWASGDHPARIEAALTAPEINIDRMLAVGQGVFGETTFEWPREGALAIKVGAASFNGVEAKRADINMRFDSDGLEIQRLSVGDVGGAALAVKGDIDTSTAYPRGAITLDLDARTLEGIATVVAKFAPRAADELRRNAERLAPAKMVASLTVNPEITAGNNAGIASFRIEGKAGTFNINMQGNAGAGSDAFTAAHFSKLFAAKTSVTGRVDAGDGNALVEFLGLDRLVAVDKRAGRLNFAASGPLDGDMTVLGQLAAGGLDLSANGSVRLAGRQGPTAGLDVKVLGANLRTPRPLAAGRPAETLPAAFSVRLTLAEGMVGLSDIAGKVAGADISGRLTIGFTPPASVDGDIQIGALNLPAIIATAIGSPSPAANAAGLWPAEPFESGLFDSLSGQIKVKSARVTVAPTLAAQDLRGVLGFDQSDISFDQIDGTLAGGRITGGVTFRRSADGLTATGRVGLAAANVAELVPAAGAPLSGQLTLNLDLEGTGRSPVALMGSLEGGGTFTLQDGRIARLDPAAFDAIIRNVDQGLPIDAERVRDRMELALGNGGLKLPLAEGEIAVAAGQARLNNAMVRAEHADLAVTGSLDLAGGALDAKLTLTGATGTGGAPQGRPEIGIVLKGPIGAPTRTLDVAALSSWLALRAVEQQAKRLDALEAARQNALDPPARVVVPPAPAAPAPPVAPETSVPQPSTPRTVRAAPENPPQPPVRPLLPPTAPQHSGPIDIRPRLAPRVQQPSATRGTPGLPNSVGP